MEQVYRLALAFQPKVGPVGARQLISHCGSAERVYKSSMRVLTSIPEIGPETARSIVRRPALREAEAELTFIRDNKIRTLFFLDEDYPARLKPYNSSPILLFYKGTAELNAERVLGIVGTRTPSSYGMEQCERIVADLAAFNVLPVSGLAYGVDACVHRSGLKYRIPNVAVLGSGMDRLYPSAHRKIARQLCKEGGLLTEFFSGEGPEREHFPMRNRIIAGMCDALLVIESGEEGGSMISAGFAFEYNKDVLALPGRVTDDKSAGCNKLIASQRAALVRSAAEIASVMMWDVEAGKRNPQRELFNDLEEPEVQIVEILQSANSSSLDELKLGTNFTPSRLAALMLNLEFKGLVKALPGKRYKLIK